MLFFLVLKSQFIWHFFLLYLKGMQAPTQTQDKYSISTTFIISQRVCVRGSLVLRLRKICYIMIFCFVFYFLFLLIFLMTLKKDDCLLFPGFVKMTIWSLVYMILKGH